MSDLYGVIGHPISHSKSPIIHRLFAEQTAQDIDYEAFDIEPDQLGSRLKELLANGVRGLNVTVPHKNEVPNLLDKLSDRAELSGAVNTITVRDDGQLSGDNTDGIGLIRDLEENLSIKLAGQRILILGAGGATRGIVPELLSEGPATLRIANRTVARARALVTQFSRLGPVSACGFEELGGQQFNLIINATSAGLKGELPPFPRSIIDSGVVCYDLSYAMTDTPFAAWARDKGAEQVHQGWGMLVEQAAESFYIWRGVRPETAPVRKRLP
jgi:shikimate dehydrogenase